MIGSTCHLATRVAYCSLLFTVVSGVIPALPQTSGERPGPPAGKLKFGGFTAEFTPQGRYFVQGQGWPRLEGTWEVEGPRIGLRLDTAPEGCSEAGTYRFRQEAEAFLLELVADSCQVRALILGDSRWLPEGIRTEVPERVIRHEMASRLAPLPDPAPAAGSWPSFRGPAAAGVGDDQNLPIEWDVESGKQVIWKTPIPGLAHSSPIVWGDRIFVTSAISSQGQASFKPGLYGAGDAAADRSEHRWMIYSLEKSTGRILWERTAFQGMPREKRHIKSTYASSTPATDGRTVVAFFGSQGLFAYDMDGNFRWKIDLGHLDAGAYDLPSIEWGNASSPILWNGIVIVQCDTQLDSFLLALDAGTGRTLWKADRDELPSWGTPNVVPGPQGPELVTNASVFIRGYDPRDGRELWRLGGSSRITAPTPIFGDGLLVVASGRGPERPIFVLRPGGRGDLTLAEGRTSSDQVVWSRQGRGPYMPTPLIYRHILYVLANNGILDAYDLASGAEIYRARVPHRGSGFSASPVASDGRIYLSSEDGEILVVGTGAEFELLATNSMGDLVMATPAISEKRMYVRTASQLVALGQP